MSLGNAWSRLRCRPWEQLTFSNEQFHTSDSFTIIKSKCNIRSSYRPQLHQFESHRIQAKMFTESEFALDTTTCSHVCSRKTFLYIIILWRCIPFRGPGTYAKVPRIVINRKIGSLVSRLYLFLKCIRRCIWEALTSVNIGY